MADCATPDGSAVQEGFGEGIEPANSVLKIWESHLEVGRPGALPKSHPSILGTLAGLVSDQNWAREYLWGSHAVHGWT